MSANEDTERRQRRRERLEAMGATPCPDYAARQGQTLVTFYGEARADPPDAYTVEEAEHELAVAAAEIERDLAAGGDPAAAIERVAQGARRARARYADALNTTARPASRS